MAEKTYWIRVPEGLVEVTKEVYVIVEDGTTIALDFGESGFKMNIIPGEMTAFSRRTEKLEIEYASSKKIYGEKFTAYQRRCVLLPLLVQLNSGVSVWLSAIVFLYANGMGVLKLELPLVDVETNPLIDFDFSQYIKKMLDKWGVGELEKHTISDIAKMYLSDVAKLGKFYIIVYKILGKTQSTKTIKSSLIAYVRKVKVIYLRLRTKHEAKKRNCYND